MSSDPARLPGAAGRPKAHRPIQAPAGDTASALPGISR